jgi:hypothetical protein
LAADVLQREDYLAFGLEALSYWSRLAIRASECAGCAYFPYSDYSADRGRYVRNTNLLTAMAASTLVAAMDGFRGPAPSASPRQAAMDRNTLTESDLRSLIRQNIAAEDFERRMGNKGYFGMLDPRMRARPTERERIENHAANMAVALLSIYHMIGNRQARDLAAWNYRSWRDCRNAACLSRPCRYWAADPEKCTETWTFAHCSFRTGDPLAHNMCERAIARTQKIFPNQLLFLLAGD